MKHLFCVILILILPIFPKSWSRQWEPDVLGQGFKQTVIEMKGTDSPVSTIVFKPAAGSKKAVLYVHGFNDYFFQTEMAQQWINHGYDFYAVDLRRYGRSIRENQKSFDTKNLKEYFEDIDSALKVIKEFGDTSVILMGHSTGGLITSYYLMYNHPSIVKALILNSPFLDWNLGKMENLVGVVSFFGKIFPNLSIPQGKSRTYAESLLKPYHGEWEYDTIWKKPVSPPVTAGWVNAINKAQNELRDSTHPIKVPVLLLMSNHSVDGDVWTPEFNKADAVLNVDEIDFYGKKLSENVKAYRFEGGLHDLALSSYGVRNAYYNTIFNWVKTINN